MARSPSTFTPKKAGEEINASADTIRRYCQLYRRHLSEGATPAPGRPRVLTAIDVHLLKLAKKATEAGSTVEEVDQLLETVAIPESLIAGEGDDQVGETLPATTAVEAVEAVALLRQMASTLERLATQGDRLASLEDQVGELRRLVSDLSAAPAPAPSPVASSPAPKPWAAYLPFAVAVAVVVVAILVIALIVALLR